MREQKMQVVEMPYITLMEIINDLHESYEPHECVRLKITFKQCNLEQVIVRTEVENPAE